MKVNNTEKLRRDVENTITNIFYDTDTSAEMIVTATGNTIVRPTIIKKNNEPLVLIETHEDEFVIWKRENGEYNIHCRMNFQFYKNKTILIAGLVYQIMSTDKYCTLY